jgi:2-amino-4-hydroxy-6-hydroxymethyldihydropteridine diphosphokinase
MIIIGIGGNLTNLSFDSPQQAGEAALAALERRGVRILVKSQWYDSAPVPPSDQPWYTNAVAVVGTALAPDALLGVLQAVESEFGRVRTVRNAARVLDLDLIAYHDRVIADGDRLIVPHPRMHERAFVLLPLAEIAPDWRHPVTGAPIAALIAALPPGQICVPASRRGAK